MPVSTPTALIISAVVSVASTALSAVAAKKAKKGATGAADRQAEIDKQRLANEAKQRDLQVARDKAEEARTTRAKIALLRNTVAVRGARTSTSARGAEITLAQAGERNTNFIVQQNKNAAEANRIAGLQSQFNRDETVRQAEDAFTGSIVAGIGGIASSAADAFIATSKPTAIG